MFEYHCRLEDGLILKGLFIIEFVKGGLSIYNLILDEGIFDFGDFKFWKSSSFEGLPINELRSE